MTAFGLDCQDMVVLHIAPNLGERQFVERRRPRLYARADLRPVPAFNLASDITCVAVASCSVDLVIAWHVLEHIPDDYAAMAEVARVLRPGGHFLMSVPIQPHGNPKTWEDPSVPPEDRQEAFGHPDHVRSCGLDYGERLTDVGLAVEMLSVRAMDPESTDRLGLSESHVAWCGTRTAR